MERNEQAKTAVQAQFGVNAHKYVTSETHAKGDDLTLMLEWLQPQPEWVVLDVATGGGHVAKRLSPHVGGLIATDLTPGMLAAAYGHVGGQNGKVLFVVADAERLPFLDAAFDAVTCRIAAHHFPDPAQFVREAARVLKPGGKLLLIDNVVPDDPKLDVFVNTLEKLRDDSHVRCCSVGEWEAWMRAAGLEKKLERLRKKTFDFPVWLRRTTRSEEQAAQVEAHLLTAQPELQEYCGMVRREQDGGIASIHIDEWMVVWDKPA